jgi:hypothetical protein
MKSWQENAFGIQCVRWFLLAICAAAFASGSRGQGGAGSSSGVTQTYDWAEWKTNCDDFVHGPNKDTLFACGSSTFRSRPFHFLAQSIVPGSGVGGGGQYARDFNSDKNKKSSTERSGWQNRFTATGVITIRQFWLAGVSFEGQHDGYGAGAKSEEKFMFNIYAHNRDLPMMTFYGLGPNTNVLKSVKFSQRDTGAGFEVYNPLNTWLNAGGKVEGLWPNVGGVTGTNVVSIQTQYTEQTAPGLTTQPPMTREEIYLRPKAHPFPRLELDYLIAYDFFQDTSTGHFSFRRFETTLQNTFYPITNKRGDPERDRSFIVRWRYSTASAGSGHAVPFYLQETLGGTDIDNQPTLRAFKDYRFRGPDLMMVQAEYDMRIRSWTYKFVGIGVMATYDAGKVALNRSDLNFSGMHQSFGGGLVFYLADKLVFRAAVALGGGEGTHPYFGINNFL